MESPSFGSECLWKGNLVPRDMDMDSEGWNTHTRNGMEGNGILSDPLEAVSVNRLGTLYHNIHSLYFTSATRRFSSLEQPLVTIR